MPADQLQTALCPRCGGRGALPVAEPECNGGALSLACDRCDGTGRIPQTAYHSFDAERHGAALLACSRILTICEDANRNNSHAQRQSPALSGAASEAKREGAAFVEAVVGVRAVDLPIQRSTREQLLSGMCGIIRRMTRVAPRGDLVLADHDERELAIALFSYLEGRSGHD